MAKNFETPASAFLSTAETETETKEQAPINETADTAAGYEQTKAALMAPKAKKAPTVETRSKHMQCLVTPSLYKQVERIAKKHKDSINGIVNKALQLYLLELEQNEKRDK